MAATDTLKSFLVSIGFDVDEASRRRTDKAVEATEQHITKIAKEESAKRAQEEATQADRRAKIDAKEQKALEQGMAKEAKERERARRAAEIAEGKEHRRRLGQVKELEKAATMTADLMAGLTGVIAGNRFFQDIRNTAESYSRLGLQSQRTGIAPSKIASIVYGLGQLGVDQGEANGSLDGFAKALQMQPGLRNVLAGRGVKTRNADGSDVDAGDIFTHLGTYFKGLPQNVALAQAGGFGISHNTLIGLQKEEELKAKIDEFGNIKGTFGLDPDKAAKDGRDMTAAYDKLASDLHAIHDRIASGFFKPMTLLMKGMSSGLESLGEGAVKIGQVFAALGALLTLRAIPPLLRLAKALAGVLGLGMPAWVMRLLGIAGPLSAPLALHSDSGSPDPSSADRAEASRREKNNGTFGWRDFLPKMVGGTGRAWHKGRQRFMERGGQGAPGVAYQATSLKQAMGLSDAEYDAFREGVTDIEGKAYGRMGGAGGRYAGRYQMGPSEIAETAKRLGVPRPSNEEFLNDPKMQERFFENYTLDHYNGLMTNPKFAAMSKREKLQVLGYAHNQGVGSQRRGTGAMGYLDSGRTGSDGWGTSGTAYFEPIGRRFDRTQSNRPLSSAPPLPSFQSAPGLGVDGKPVTLAPSSTSIRGDSAFHQTNNISVNGDHRTAVAVADTVKASARRGGQDYIRFMGEGSGQA